MDSVDRFLKLLLIVAILISLSVAVLRGKMDVENVAVEVMVDFEEIDAIAHRIGIETSHLLREMAGEGVSSLILRGEVKRGKAVFPQEAIGEISEAAMRVIPLLPFDSSLTAEVMREALSHFTSLYSSEGRGINAVALKGRVGETDGEGRGMDFLRGLAQYLNEKGLWVLFVDPLDKSVKRQLGRAVGERYTNCIEVFPRGDEWQLVMGNSSSLEREMQHSSVRAIYVRFFHEDGIDDTEQGREWYLSRLRLLREKLRKEGFYPHSKTRFRGMEVDTLSQIGLAAGVWGVLLLTIKNVIWLRKRAQYIVLFLPFLIFLVLFFRGDPFLLKRSMASLSMMLFPVLGLAGQFVPGRMCRFRSRGTAPYHLRLEGIPFFFGRTFKGFISILLLSLAGGLIGAAFLTDTPFIKGTEAPFDERWIYIAVIALVLIIYLNRFARGEEESIPAFLRRVGDSPLRLRHLAFLLFITSLVWGFSLLRENIALLADFYLQQIGRKVLSPAWLPIAPVLEMLLGLPLYFIAAYQGLQGRRGISFLLSMVGTSTGFTALSTAFNRITLPILVILLNVSMNIVAGIFLGVVLFLSLLIVDLCCCRRAYVDTVKGEEAGGESKPYV